MNVTIYGPNLRDQTRGTFHVHAAGCAHGKHYGPGTKFGGDDAGLPLEADSATAVVEFIYADQLAEHDGDVKPADWLDDFHFAPCARALPTDTPGDARQEGTTMTNTRTKTASAPLLETNVYGDTPTDRLEAERLTINNRLSGLRTRLGRTGSITPEKREQLVGRLRDMLERRDLIKTELTRRKAVRPGEAADKAVRPTEAEDKTKTKPAKKRGTATRAGRSSRKAAV